MKSYKIAFSLALMLLLSGISQARDYEPEPLINVAKNGYYNKNIPFNKFDTMEYLEPYDKTYDPAESCIDPSDFKITNLAMKLHYGFITKKQLNYPWYYAFGIQYQYDYQFHVVKIDYEITCRNKLKYKGREHLASPPRISNNTTPGNGKIGEDMAKEAYDYIENLNTDDYINADGSITIDARYNKTWRYVIAKVDTASILKKWEEQRVTVPPFTYTGKPGKLSRPVLLVHGLRDNYGEWGVVTSGKGSYEFKNGEAMGYKIGSLPDMLARSNNLNSTDSAFTESNDVEFSINNNGIYFFQAEENSVPHWKKDDSLSQSWMLYKKIEKVMDDFYKNGQCEGWRDIGPCKIDLVAHSQGGLAIREMLRGLLEKKETFPQENSNAANHINRIITVNTPHLGSALMAPYGSAVLQNYKGLIPVIKNIESKEKRELLNIMHLEANNPAMSIVSGTAGFAGGFYDGANLILKSANANSEAGFWEYTAAFFVGILGATVSMVRGTEISVNMTGPYFGPYGIDIVAEQLFSDKTVYSGEIDFLKKQRGTIEKNREKDGHLYEKDDFMIQLNSGNMYPRLPNGNDAVLLPMYSDSSHKILPEALYSMATEAAEVCARQKYLKANCSISANIVLGRLNEYINKISKNSVSEADFSDELPKILVNAQETWLKKSDGLVEVSSQKFIKGSNSPDNHKGYFLEPRPYAIHDALAHWEAVFHGEVFGNKGAAQQGRDILCALLPACDSALTLARQNGRNAVLKLSDEVITDIFKEDIPVVARYSSTLLAAGEFKERSIDIAGDMNLAPIYEGEGIQGLAISANNETILTAKYEPGKGSFITLKKPAAQPELIQGPEIATQPYVIRKGDSISISFMNYSGKEFKKDYFMPGLSNNLTVSVIAESNAEMSPVIIGNAIAANPESQKPSVPPPGHPLAPITLAIIHREARENEANTSRPRFLVYNATKDTLEFSKIAYYFTADPARVPNVVIDYPQHIPVSVESLGGDKWRFVLNAGSQKVPPRSFYPSAEGWQIRMYYSDWYDYDHLNDWSANYSVGFAKFNDRIVIYDKNGKIIWGNEPPLEEKDEDLTQKATLAWKDDSPWEANTLKPRVEIKNTGDLPLSDYHAQFWFRVPHGKSLAIPSPDVWYTPESKASAKNISGRVWMLDMHFDKHILYSGDSVSEGNIGLHLTDWSVFDKTVCGVALKDKDGNVLFGREPSVAECESHEEQNLLLPLYSRRWK
jgi:hypothetical protein